MATTAALLALYATPAIAACPAPAGGTCQWGGKGAAGAPAQSSGAPSNGDGHDGGPGGAGPSGSLGEDNLNWVADIANQWSPLQLVTNGGDGAQGSDATAGLDGKSGGHGGLGGDGGSLNITMGSGMSGNGSGGISAISIFSTGGTGGGGASANLNTSDSQNGVSGDGGTGGALTLDLDGVWSGNSGATNRSLAAQSTGGPGGGGRAWKAGLNEDGIYGGAGGTGGAMNVTLRGTFTNATGAAVVSMGGAGGAGGAAENWPGSIGGKGGAGGAGGDVNVTTTATSVFSTRTANDAALTVNSQGGVGGVGGTGPSGGAAGSGGNGGATVLALQGGTFNAAGSTSSLGILAQSLGGNGGDGGSGGHVIGPNGGSGSDGGTPGSVAVSGSGLATITTGAQLSANSDPTLYGYSPGILAQAIGGGGGGGGDANGWFSVGGDGGQGIAGGNASVDVLAKITTYGANSDGLSVQSIGGGGGKGGDAKGSGVEVNMIIGGTGGGGGAGEDAAARLQTGGAIATFGAHSSGLVIQSVGGGGGAGGAAYSKSTNLLYGASISLGGSGGAGGDGSTVGFVSGAATTNAGRIYTTGSDSHGILGQSIGGGGGIGGASTAISKTYSDDDYPSLSLTLSMGGTGGDGGSASDVTLDNSGLIFTKGAGSLGVLAQSVGGGGGTGGDASSASTATGGEVNIASSFTFGGKAGSGNEGGVAGVSNNGFIITTGESADGMLVQSIGGGGGNGGGGDGKSSASSGTSISATITMGGSAGGGGNGQSATATNAGSIITLGDGGFGVAAQSIGGGGGRGGGAAGSATGDYTGSATVGGSGGNGGNGGSAVTVTNKAGAAIVTFGADANGVIAQSIGGGGGAAGKSATNISTKKSTNDGGNGDAAGTADTMSALSSKFDASGMAGLSSYGGLNGAITAVNSLLGLGAPVGLLGDVEDDLDDTAESKGETDDDNNSSSINISVAVGGTGGAGGNAGAVVIDNYGEVATMGHHADAIVGMAIGGGGGKGGAAATAASDDNKNGNVSVGGSGGNGGWGSTVTITNTGDIYTKGALAAGIVAQSIAGGGGIGGASASSISASSKKSGDDDANDGAFKSLQISVGGNGGGSYNSGQVVVNSSGAISTAAHDSIGILAQSITGGGGIVKTLATDQEGAGGAASAKGTEYDINFKFNGGQGGTSGGSGLVHVTTTKGGSITTRGDNSHGVLAQSIAGGGGLALGGRPVGGSAASFFGTGSTAGSVINDGGDNSGMVIEVGDDITTFGKGAIGVFAQSIGGGGGVAGDTGNSEQFWGMSGMTHMTGSGGVIDVTLAAGATISTSGANAPAVFLQSIGGGGGRITNDNGAFVGTAGGSGAGGAVTFTNHGTIQTTGAASVAVFVQSSGDSTSNAPIIINNWGAINGTNAYDNGSDNNAAIYIDHGGTGAGVRNTLNNWGVITTLGGLQGTAVYGNAGYTYIVNSGTITGDIHLANGGGGGCLDNISGGTLNTQSIDVGDCTVTNSGTINLAGSEAATSTITGDYIGTGKLVFDADFAGGKSDHLVVHGDAAIGDAIIINAKTMRNAPITMLTATGTLTLKPEINTGSGSHLYSYDVKTDGTLLTVTPRALFEERAAAYGANEKSVAQSLQALFDGGVSADAAFTRLASVADDAAYASAIKQLTGEALGAFGAFRFNSSRTFATNLYGDCGDLQFAAKSADRCGWARVVVNNADQTANADGLGYKADAWTLQTGFQLPLSENLGLTASAAYEKTTFRDGGASIKGDALAAGVGLFYAPDRLELSAGFDMSWGNYESRRDIALGGLSELAAASPKQSQLGGHLRAAYDLVRDGDGFVRPFVEGHLIRVSNKAFTENGASPFRLAVEAQADIAVIGVAGVELGTKLALSETISLRPFASGAIEFNEGRDWTSTARFADHPGSESFDLTTAGPGTLGRFAIGADLIGAKNITFSIKYAPEFGKDYTSHSGTARVTLAF